MDNSKNTDRAAHWNGIHSKAEPDQVSWYQRAPMLSLRMLEKAGFSPESGVIDIGGGVSSLVDELLDRGCEQISVLDVSVSALDHTKNRLGDRGRKVRWIVGDVLEAELEGVFDFWHDRAVFHFLTREEDRRAYMERLHGALKVGGHVIFATFAPDGPEKCSGLPVVRYCPEDLQKELGDGFDLVATERETHRTPKGGEQRFLFCLFKRK
jgi:SAM-dependent methyltransferase